MGNELENFILQAKQKNLTTDEIKSKLLAAGWSEDVISAALGDQLIAPPPPTKGSETDAPNPLTQREETVRLKMFEYSIMFLTLWVAALAMFWLFNGLLFGSDYSELKFPLTAIIVCLPVFLVLFLRVRKHEERDPELKHISGRLHLVQNSEGVAFVILLIHTIYVLYQFLSGTTDNLAQQFLSWIGSLVLFGGIFAYYWFDTHRASRSR